MGPFAFGASSWQEAGAVAGEVLGQGLNILESRPPFLIGHYVPNNLW